VALGVDKKETIDTVSIHEYIESHYDEYEDGIKNEDYEEIDPALIISEKDIYSEIEVREFISKLEPNERTVLQLSLDGYTYREILRKLRISERQYNKIKNAIREKAARYFNS